MSTDEPFGPWVEPMERAGARNPRSRDGSISWGGLARKAGLSTSAVTNAVYGRTKRPDPQTIQKIADALGEKPEAVSAWIELERPVGKPWQPDKSSSLLYPHERGALDELIRAITRGREDGGEHEQRSASNTQPSPAGDAGQQGSVTRLRREPEVEQDEPMAASPAPPEGTQKERQSRAQDNDAERSQVPPGDDGDHSA